MKREGRIQKTESRSQKTEYRSENPGPDAGTVAELADMVVSGQIVEACLTDGTFVALMNELRRRGWVLRPRAEDEAGRWLKPFLYRVEFDGIYRDAA
jgi:hypothetical protein